MAKYLNIDGANYNQYFTQVLGSSEYVLHVYYNTRQSGWFISLYDATTFDWEALDNTQSRILGGKRIMPSGDILEGIEDERAPEGLLVCADYKYLPRSKAGDVTLGNFGKDSRWRLTYYTQEELLGIYEGTSGSSKYYFQSLSTIPRDDLPVVPVYEKPLPTYVWEDSGIPDIGDIRLAYFNAGQFRILTGAATGIEYASPNGIAPWTEQPPIDPWGSRISYTNSSSFGTFCTNIAGKSYLREFGKATVERGTGANSTGWKYFNNDRIVAVLAPSVVVQGIENPVATIWNAIISATYIKKDTCLYSTCRVPRSPVQPPYQLVVTRDNWVTREELSLYALTGIPESAIITGSWRVWGGSASGTGVMTVAMSTGETNVFIISDDGITLSVTPSQKNFGWDANVRLLNIVPDEEGIYWAMLGSGQSIQEEARTSYLPVGGTSWEKIPMAGRTIPHGGVGYVASNGDNTILTTGSSPSTALTYTGQ